MDCRSGRGSLSRRGGYDGRAGMDITGGRLPWWLPGMDGYVASDGACVVLRTVYTVEHGIEFLDSTIELLVSEPDSVGIALPHTAWTPVCSRRRLR